MPRNTIALAGFMGTGKSTVGQMVAERLGWRFVDTDHVIEARAGCTIAELFATQGESAFRQLEAEVCVDLSPQEHTVLALGGGALINPATQAIVSANSLLICLSAALDTLIARVGDDPARPLFSADHERLAALYSTRAAHYAGLPHHIDTSGITPTAVAEEVLTLWHQHR